MTSTEQALAFAARRQGRTSMPATEWAHVLSLELGWMTPGEATRYIEAATAGGLLASDGDALRVTFDPAAVEIPRGFRPDPSRLATPAAAPTAAPASNGSAAPGPIDFRALLALLGEDRDAAMRMVADIQDAFGGHLAAEAAALVGAKREGHDVAALAKRLIASA